MSFFHLTFRVTSLVRRSEPHLQFGIQSRIFILAESCIFNQAFKVVVHFQFDIQSHHISFNLAFRVVASVWLSKLYFQFDIQSYCLFLVRHSESLCLSFIWHSEPHLQFSVQSCWWFLVRHSKPSCLSSIWHSEPLFSLTFYATIFLWFWHSESLCILFQAFRVTIFPLFWRSESCLHFGIQSHCSAWHSVSPFFFSFGIQSRCAYSFRHFESQFFPPFWHPESFILSLVIQIQSSQHSYSLALHILPLRFRIRPHFSHLLTSCLSFLHHVLIYSIFHRT